MVMPTGTKTSERFSSDPVTAYVVDGTIALNTPDGDRVNEAGNLFVIEPGAPYQFTAVGDVPSHLLLATLIPVAE